MAELFLNETPNDYSNRSFPDRVGSSTQRGSKTRTMVRRRENFTHKYVGTTSNKIGSIFLHQKEKSEIHTLLDRQQGNLVKATFSTEYSCRQGIKKKADSSE